MNKNFKKMLGITLVGLMAVAPMVASASGNSVGMTKSIEATEATEAEIANADNKASVGAITESIEATMVLGVEVGDESPGEAMTKSIEATEILEFAKEK